MNRMNSALPLVKDVSFGGGPQSLGVVSSSTAAKQLKPQDAGGSSSVFPATMQSQIVFSTLMGRGGSVTPRPTTISIDNSNGSVTHHHLHQ